MKKQIDEKKLEGDLLYLHYQEIEDLLSEIKNIKLPSNNIQTGIKIITDNGMCDLTHYCKFIKKERLKGLIFTYEVESKETKIYKESYEVT